MEKINQVIDMIEHPEKYSDAQVEEILQDEECRQTYFTMVEMRMTFDKEGALENLDIDQEWQNLQRSQKTSYSRFSWTKIAASFVGVVLLSGIAVAAIHTYSSHEDNKQIAADTTFVSYKSTNNGQKIIEKQKDGEEKVKKIIHKTFDNVALSNMLEEVSKYYGVTVVFRNEEAKQLRFYYEWNSEDDLSKVVDELNHSQQMNLAVEDGKIIVE